MTAQALVKPALPVKRWDCGGKRRTVSDTRRGLLFDGRAEGEAPLRSERRPARTNEALSVFDLEVICPKTSSIVIRHLLQNVLRQVPFFEDRCVRTIVDHALQSLDHRIAKARTVLVDDPPLITNRVAAAGD